MAARLINKPLTETEFKQFYQLTKGNISKINSGLESFIFKCATKTESNTSVVVKGAALAACVVAVAGFSYIYYTGVAHKQTGETLTHNTSLPSISQVVNQQTAYIAREVILVSSIPIAIESTGKFF